MRAAGMQMLSQDQKTLAEEAYAEENRRWLGEIKDEGVVVRGMNQESFDKFREVIEAKESEVSLELQEKGVNEGLMNQKIREPEAIQALIQFIRDSGKKWPGIKSAKERVLEDARVEMFLQAAWMIYHDYDRLETSDFIILGNQG